MKIKYMTMETHNALIQQREEAKRNSSPYDRETNVLCEIEGCDGVYWGNYNYIMSSNPEQINVECNKCKNKSTMYI